jgi:hypothetical protein
MENRILGKSLSEQVKLSGILYLFALDPQNTDPFSLKYPVMFTFCPY